MTYEVLTGYDASKSDAENLPYVAAHCQNRPQIYADYFSQSPTNDDILKVTNYDDFEVSFDYKFDGFGTATRRFIQIFIFVLSGCSVVIIRRVPFTLQRLITDLLFFCGEATSLC